MLRFLSKLLTNHNSKTGCTRFVRTLSSSSSKAHDLTLHYLTNSCGMSLQSATSACKFVRIQSEDKADLVLQLLRAKGFTLSQIASLISNRPYIISSDPDKILKPKLEYFESLGFAAPSLPNMLCADATILSTSLKNRILPNIDFLRGFLETEDDVLWTLKRWFSVVRYDTELMMSTICTLCACGVPVPTIRKLVLLHPKLLIIGFYSYEEKIQELKGMGIEPTSKVFLTAFFSMCVMSRRKWERKKKFLMSFGWSERDFLMAFRVQPLFVTTSEQKMKKVMEFYLTKAGLQVSDLVRSPHLLRISLEGNAIPRCSVLEVLMSKGLIKKKLNVVAALRMSRKPFETKYLTYFKEDCPELIQAYQAKTFQGFGMNI
ncbi:uncharacterized protein LOC110605653 [Manihot esculenta]|uniref:Uncharacterized protein n=1 Tax=Manihot esculenta TaxID=3983 RepID=A0A251IWG8_MANES|nr:uncharacterized protein LOC110605653 [Manihot esculenta]XP_021599983.1 uncharacterized protein LOC110605653 [Manihot esculenta]XP_021599984.1 uncharacterized protein LOC110605653 [Manihot esculenta]OAY25563.1 hypothetical protein MANES_17G104900v8 [Manihot esculenta]